MNPAHRPHYASAEDRDRSAPLLPVPAFVLLVAMTLPVQSLAADAPADASDNEPMQAIADTEAEEALEPGNAFTRAFSGEVELGLGTVSDDSFAFGRYTGLEEQGAFPLGDFNVRLRPGRPDYLYARGRNLGLNSRSLLFKYGKQGTYDTYFSYDQLPNFTVDTAQTPFTGAGTSDLTYTSVLRGLDLETERKRLGAGFTYRPNRHWITSLAVRREVKQGTGVIGGALLDAGAGAGFGNSFAALLPQPIDYVTNLFDLTLGYVNQRYQWQLAYHLSLFENDAQSLTWDEPTLPSTGEGRLALPPDNQFHQITFSGAYGLTDTTRLTGLLSTGWMFQDESFLPYRVGGTVAELPRTSLDGEVQVHAAKLGISARPLRALRLRADYRYDERDNNTAQVEYDYFPLDSTVASGAAVTNQPLSYKKHKVDLDASYRFSRRVRAGLGYEYRNTKREFSDVEENDEHTVSARLKLAPTDAIDLSLKLARMERDASDYQAEIVGQNSLLRKYYLADETQDQAGIVVSYMPHQSVTLGLSADLIKDDYDETQIGLTEADRQSYTLDVSYVPREDWVFYGFYTLERYSAGQLGSSSDAVETSDWRVEFDDDVDTFGAGAKITGIKGKWDLGVDYVYMDGESDIRQFDSGAPAAFPYPTLTNRLQTIRLYALYHVRKDMDIKLTFLHEAYDSTDWALDGLEPESVTDLVLLGDESPDYDNNVVTASIRYRF